MNEESYERFIDLLLPWREATDDQISDVFVYVIGAAFLLFGFYFFVRTFIQRRLICSLIKEIRKYDSPAQPRYLHELKETFSNKGNLTVTEKFSSKVKLTEAWQEFEDSLITRDRGENKSVAYKTDEAALFFSEDRLLDQHLNLRFWNSVPALLVGFGILGTFVGLVRGLIPFSGINFTQSEEIRTAIQVLLSGVSTAFVTSVWGMLTSLVFNGLEKWRIGRVSQAIANLQRALDQLFTLTTQEAISFRQEDELTQQTAALKSFSTDLADRIKIAMDNIMSERLENLHQGLKQLHDHNLEGRLAIIKELQNAPEAFSSAMAERLTPSLDSLNTAVEELRRQREESSTDAIQRLVEEFHNSISGSTTEQFEELAETVRSASAGLAALPEQLRDMITSVQEQIDQSRQLLSATSEEQTGQLQGLMEGMLNAFQRAVDLQQSSLSEATNQSIQALQSTIAQLQESITSTASQNATESEAMMVRMRELLESSANQTGEQLNRRMADIDAVSSQSIQALQSTIAQLQESITSTASQNTTESEAMIIRMRELLESAANQTGEQLNRRMADIEAVSNQSIQTLEAAITELQQALTSTLDTQQQAIGNITSQTSTAFTESSDRMRQLVDQSVERLERVIRAGEQSVSTLLNQQGDQIRAINAQIANSQETLARGRDMLDQMNTSVASVRQMIETTQALSSQLMLGADRLETAGQRLTQASNAFNQENENYLAANRETIQQLQGTLVQSRELLNGFAQRFQTIDDGLQGIFAEIETGLTNYSTITRDTINKYLGAFPTHLDNAATALAGSIQALREEVDQLNDIIERLSARSR